MIVPVSLWLATGVALLFAATTDLGWITIVIVASGVLAIAFTFDALGLTDDSILRPPDPAVERVRRLVDALAESTKVIAAIEQEVKVRERLAERLQTDVQRRQELLALNRQEVEAVAQTFRLAVRREGWRGFWIGVGVNAFFFGLGVAATLLL